MVYQENKYNKVLQRSLCVAKLQSIHLGERYCPWVFFRLDWTSGGPSSSDMACIRAAYPAILH